MSSNAFSKKSSSRLFLSLGFIGYLILVLFLSWNFFEKRWEEDVSSSKPEYFPVVVVTPDKSELILTKELEGYRQNNPNYTFLISDVKSVNQQLVKSQNQIGGKGAPHVNVKSISEGRQLIEFEIIGDGLYKAKYEASEKEVKPLTFTLTGPMFILLPCSATIFLGLAGFGVLHAVLWYLRKRRNKEII